MPEETDRVLADYCSDLLLCPTPTAVDNPARENITLGAHLTEDVMVDALLRNREVAGESSVPEGLNPNGRRQWPMAGAFWLEPILTGLLPESGDLKRRTDNQVHLARVRSGRILRVLGLICTAET